MTTTDKDFVVKNGLIVQGAQGTIDGSVIVTEASLNTSLGDYIALTEKGAADGVAELDASANVKTVSAVVFEGATLNTHQVSLQIALDPTVDRTITIPDVTGTIVTTGNINDAYPSQSGQTGKYLKTDGTNVSWSTVSAGTMETLTIGTGLSGTSYNGSSAVTIAIDSTVVTTSGTQTLTNKTLTTPTLTTPALTLSTTSSTTDGRIAWDSANDKILVGGTLNGTAQAIEFASSTLTISTPTFTTNAYTAALTDKDRWLELSNGATAGTFQIPTDASVAFPIGTQLNIVQTGAGQITIAAVTPGTTTVNGTPGLKLRAQWSAATIIKRAANTWVAIGDLSA